MSAFSERVTLTVHTRLDIFTSIFSDFVEIHGDRRYADDAAIVCGFARLDGHEVAVIGQQKGRDINQRRHRNFAMTKPEGYRKALRVMKLAEKFGRPIITIIDTPGAYPGIDAEERGQAEAIAFNLREMAGLKVPVIAIVLGEGGSGGSARHRHRRPGHHDGKRCVLGDLTRRLCFDTVEGRGPGRPSCRVPAV